VADLSHTKPECVTTFTAEHRGIHTYTIAVTNAGPADATGVTLSDTWPGGFTRGTTTPSQGTCTTTTGQNFSCSLGTIPAGGSATVTVTYTVPASTPAGPQTNTVTVSSPVSDPNTANNTDSDTNTVVTSGDLAVTKDDGVSTVIAGDGVTRIYTITVSNIAGPSDATSVTLSDTWPSGFTRGTITPSQGTCTPAMTGQNFTCALGPLAKGGSATVTVTYTVPASTPAGPQTHTVTVSSDTPDSVPGNNTASDTNTVATSADLSVTKTDGVTTVTAGAGVTYTYLIAVSNAGPSDA